MARVRERACNAGVCHSGGFLAGASSAPEGTPDSIHVVVMASWGGCQLVDVLEIPLPGGPNLVGRIDGLQLRFPRESAAWLGFVPL